MNSRIFKVEDLQSAIRSIFDDNKEVKDEAARAIADISLMKPVVGYAISVLEQIKNTNSSVEETETATQNIASALYLGYILGLDHQFNEPFETERYDFNNNNPTLKA